MANSIGSYYPTQATAPIAPMTRLNRPAVATNGLEDTSGVAGLVLLVAFAGLWAYVLLGKEKA